MSPSDRPSPGTPRVPKFSRDDVGCRSSSIPQAHADAQGGGKASPSDLLPATEAQALRFWSTGVPVMRLARLVHRCALEQAAWVDRTFLTARAAAILSREAMLAGGLRAFLMENGLQPRDLLLGPSETAWQRLTPWVCEAIQDIHLENEEVWAALASKTDAHPLLTPFAKSGAQERTRRAGPPGWLLRANSHGYLVHLLALRRDQTLAATVRFHRLPRWTRQAVQAVLWEGRSVEACLRIGFGPHERLLREVRRGLDALLQVGDLWPKDPRPDTTAEGGFHATS